MSIFQPKAKRKIKIRELNENIVCYLCEGYLVRPVAVTECLHTFCRSCVVGFLENASEYRCPQCDVLIHETNPWDMIKEDKTLEDIIFKMIPGLYDNERKRKRNFYEALGMQVDESSQDGGEVGLYPQKENAERMENKAVKEGSKDKDLARKRPKTLENSQIGFCLNSLESKSTNRSKSRQIRNLEKKFIRCSCNVTIEHLKKYLTLKLKLPSNFGVDVLCNGEIMGRHHTLEFIYMTRWRFKDTLLSLDYRPKLELAEN